MQKVKWKVKWKMIIINRARKARKARMAREPFQKRLEAREPFFDRANLNP